MTKHKHEHTHTLKMPLMYVVAISLQLAANKFQKIAISQMSLKHIKPRTKVN